ncbi:uncharacterized protein METZ01_LOCUS116994 [marine metagenome]|uniref:Uncharacterized protein n=1 Tax=marine metagenome TaxID=408172 RepID=A0A381XHQ2_9ZZZZ
MPRFPVVKAPGKFGSAVFGHKNRVSLSKRHGNVWKAEV